LDELGVFSVAATLCLLLNVITQSLYKSFEPVIFKEFYNDSFQNTNMKLFKVYLFSLFAGSFCISIFSKEFFEIVTSDAFYLGYKIVPFLIIPIVISGINTFYGIHIIAAKKTKLNSITFTLNAGINVVLNFIFIPFWGYYGAIMASTISFLITNLIFQYNVNIEKKYLLSQFVLVSLVTIAPIFFNNYFHLSVFFAIIVKTILCLIFFILILFFLDLNYIKLKEILLNRIKKNV